VKRVLVYLSALVGVGGAIYLAGQIHAAPEAQPPARSGGKIAVFNVAKVMKNYQRWQYFAKVMNDKRVAASGDLGKLRNDIATMQAEAQQATTPKTRQDELAKLVVAKQREFEDKERTVRKMLDEESSNYLRGLFTEIQKAVKAIVDTNGFDLVMAYPDATTAEEMNSPMYFDLKMRPPAAMPFYVSQQADMTDVLVLTLNKNFPPPVQAAGATAPAAAPGTPPKK
jgi:Skp family chaperone for outer membrane proteins